MIEINEKKNCCGCTACVAVCPKGCISMKEDEEGFFYPSVDKTQCVDCGACDKVCPIANKKTIEHFKQKAYILQNKNEEELQESTAGGAFTPIAKYVLQKGGVVFGVQFTETLEAHHIHVENEKDLYRFRNSKYVQSFVGEGTFNQIKSFLRQGRTVCFSGTPCQIEGLKSYLGRDYENLITVDVVCRAVPSPLIFKKYVEYQEARTKETIKTVRFRDKHYGYKYSTMNVITDKNHGKYHEGVESDPWLRAFFSNICDRPSCHKCRFRSRYRVSDFTIWDCFHVGRFSKELDNDRGATRVLVHTQKACKLFNAIKESFNYVEVEPDVIVEGAKEMQKSVLPNAKREEFFADAQVLDGKALFEKYFPNTFRVKVEHTIRLLCYKLGIYSIAKKAYVRLTHKY